MVGGGIWNGDDIIEAWAKILVKRLSDVSYVKTRGATTTSDQLIPHASSQNSEDAAVQLLPIGFIPENVWCCVEGVRQTPHSVVL